MKKNQIFIAAGTFALAIVGFLQTNAKSKKFVSATSAYYLRSGSVITVFKGATTTNLTTVVQANKTAQIKTGAAATTKLFAVRTLNVLSKTCFIKP